MSFKRRLDAETDTSQNAKQTIFYVAERRPYKLNSKNDNNQDNQETGSFYLSHDAL